MRKRCSVETSELASRLILLIQISSLGNCCIDWTTKARRKTLQHSIIHTDRHNAPPSPHLSLLIPFSFLEESVRSTEGARQTSRCVCVGVGVIWLWSYLQVRAGECLSGLQLLFVCLCCTLYIQILSYIINLIHNTYASSSGDIILACDIVICIMAWFSLRVQF